MTTATKLATAALIAVIILIALWATGVFDKTLSSTGLQKNDCIVLAANGETLCGGQAKAWCDATDDLREQAGDVKGQALCDQIRGR